MPPASSLWGRAVHTAIVLLSLGMAVAVAAGSLADHAALITNRNLAADRAERAAASFIEGCSSQGCDRKTIIAKVGDRSDQTVLESCVHSSGGAAVLRVGASVPWRPRVFTGLTPATATVAVDLGGFSALAIAVLDQC